MGYWSWWYKRNKKDLQTIGFFSLLIAMIAFAMLMIYSIIKINEYIENAIENLPKEPTNFNPLPFLIILFFVIIFLLCFFSYRKYRKENPELIQKVRKNE